MKRIFSIFAALFLTATVWAQSPEKMSYQAVIRNSSDQLVTNQQVGMQISLLQGSASGTVVYTETQMSSTNANGLVSIEIGTGTTTDDFSTIDWANGVYYIKTETDPTGGTSYTITGTSQLLSVPYALHAKAADTITGLIAETDPVYASSQAVYITAADIANLGNLSGVNTGDLDATTQANIDVIFRALVNMGVIASDIDGNNYSTIQIGTQVWMGENLKTTKYNDGTAIPMVTDIMEWANLTTPGYCWYNNDSATNALTYGALYNWYTVETGNLCPTGWHVSTEAEWTTLTDYLGIDGAGGKLKEAGNTHWIGANTGATNETGFSALPGGYRNYAGGFEYVSAYGNWWNPTESSTTNANGQGMRYDSSNVNMFNGDKKHGLSVRCIKD